MPKRIVAGSATPQALARQIFGRALSNMDSARHGLGMLRGGRPSERFQGVKEVAIHGRTVTAALHTLKGVVEGWEDFWVPVEKQLAGNTLARYFYKLRNEIEKKGDCHVASLLLPSTPGGLVELRSGMQGGRPGEYFEINVDGAFWVSKLSSHEVQYRPAVLPMAAGVLSHVFTDTHEAPVPAEYRNAPIEKCCEDYLALIEAVLFDALKRFAPELKLVTKTYISGT